MFIGPVNFAGMQPVRSGWLADEPQTPTEEVSGLQLFGGRVAVERGLIEDQLHRPYLNHQQRTPAQAGFNAQSALPAHIAKDLRKLQAGPLYGGS